MNNKELKPCPFCGGEDVQLDSTAPPSEIAELIESCTEWVVCEDCGASSDSFSTEQKAADKWNTRHYEAQIEALHKQVDHEKLMAKKFIDRIQSENAKLIKALTTAKADGIREAIKYIAASDICANSKSRVMPAFINYAKHLTPGANKE